MPRKSERIPGQCTTCPGQSGEGHTRCAACRKRLNAQCKKERAQKILAGVCVKGKCQEYPVAGSLMCGPHRDSHYGHNKASKRRRKARENGLPVPEFKRPEKGSIVSVLQDYDSIL